jgi:hypothetical protein
MPTDPETLERLLQVCDRIMERIAAGEVSPGAPIVEAVEITRQEALDALSELRSLVAV